MGKSNKWIEVERTDAPAGEYVTTILTDRLEVVADALDAVAGAAADDPERVHQLRVATRRAGAAVAAVGDFLPRRRGKRLRKRLRAIRRAAGEARDLDVLAARFSARQENDSAAPDAALDWLWPQIVARRRLAQAGLENVCRKFCDGQFARKVHKVVRRTQWRGKGDEPSCAELARASIADAAENFFAAAHRRPSTIKELHELRIAGKRLRYSLELFAAALDLRLRDEIYPVIEQIQERLGAINDRGAAATLIAEWKDPAADKTPSDVIERLAQQEDEAGHSLAADFLSWWTPERAKALEATVADAIRVSPPESH